MRGKRLATGEFTSHHNPFDSFVTHCCRYVWLFDSSDQHPSNRVAGNTARVSRTRNRESFFMPQVQKTETAWECSVDDYAYTRGLDHTGWAWEFLRRNEDYQRDFRINRAGHPLPTKHISGAVVLRLRRRFLDAQKWGLHCFADPYKSARDAADPLCRRFMEIPGVGPIAALSFRAGVDDPMRFSSSRVVGAHFGLTPKKWQSGTIDMEGSISKQGDVDVRTALCEAAASMLLRSKKWTALRAWGLRIAKRSSMKNAMIAVARKLAVIMHRMWIDGSDYMFGKGAEVSEKRILIGTIVD
jgi:hypothetical protein